MSSLTIFKQIGDIIHLTVMHNLLYQWIIKCTLYWTKDKDKIQVIACMWFCNMEHVWSIQKQSLILLFLLKVSLIIYEFTFNGFPPVTLLGAARNRPQLLSKLLRVLFVGEMLLWANDGQQNFSCFSFELFWRHFLAIDIVILMIDILTWKCIKIN